MSKPPSRSLTLLTFWAAGNVSLVPFSQVTCAKFAPASQAFHFPGGGARRSQRRTYPSILALEGNVLDDLLITFRWSSVRPWVPRVWLAPWPGPSWVRFCGRGGLSGRTGRVGPRPFLCRGRVAGSGEPGPRPGDVGGICRVFVRVRHHGRLGLGWVSSACAGQVDAFPAGVSDGQVLVECVARSRFVGWYKGVLLGKVGLPGVVVVDGRSRSRWFDAPRRVIRREEVIPGPLYRLLPCGGPVRDSRRVCAAVRRRCSAGGRLWWAGHACAASAGAGRSRVFMRVCSWFRLTVAQGPGGFTTRRMRALRRALRISCTRAACAAWAFVSVRMVGCSCSPSTSARIWWIAKTGHRLGAVGVSAVCSRWGMASSCCRPSRWKLHVADHTLVCGQRRRANRQRH